MPLPEIIQDRLQNRAPEVIQVRIGEKTQTKTGTEYPRSLDYFAFWRMKDGREITRDNELARQYDPQGKPQAIPVRLLFDSDEGNIRTFLACYDSKRRFCYNDKGGDIALRRDAGGSFREMPCNTLACPIWRNTSDATKGDAQKELQAAGLSAKLQCKVNGIFRFALKGANGEDITGPGEIASFRTTSERMVGDILTAVKGALRLARGLHDILARTDKGLADTIFVSDIIAQMPYNLQMTIGRTPYGVKHFVSLVPGFGYEAIADIVLQRARSMTIALGGFNELKALLPAQQAIEDSDEYAGEMQTEFYPDNQNGHSEAPAIAPEPPSEAVTGETGESEYNDAEFEDAEPDGDAFDDSDNIFNPVEPPKTKGTPKPLIGFVLRAGANDISRVYNSACANWPMFCKNCREGGANADEMPPENLTTAAQAVEFLKQHRELVKWYDREVLGNE